MRRVFRRVPSVLAFIRRRELARDPLNTFAILCSILYIAKELANVAKRYYNAVYTTA